MEARDIGNININIDINGNGNINLNNHIINGNGNENGNGNLNLNHNDNGGLLAETNSISSESSLANSNIRIISNNRFMSRENTDIDMDSNIDTNNDNDNDDEEEDDDEENDNNRIINNNNIGDNTIDMENDPDTDDEQHARSQILRTRARTNSISLQRISLLSDYSTKVGGAISVLPPEMLCLIFAYVHSKKDLLSIALTCKYWADLIISMIWFRPGINNRNIFNKLEKTMKLDSKTTIWNYRKFIKRLNLSLIPGLVNDDFLNLFVGCMNLERITLVNCSKITSNSISNLLENCKRLQSIDLTGVTNLQDEIYFQLSKHCKRLQGLYAPGSMNISKGAVCQLVLSCPLLKRVKLSDCNSIDDEVINLLVENCQNLVELDIHGCEKISNNALFKIFSELDNLKEFKISKNQNINYECLENSFNGSILSLDKLRILDFTQCSNITDKSIIKFVKLAPKLRNVVLSKCSSITDLSLKAIATLGKNLQYIHLGHCSNITDIGAKELIKGCYRLQYIDLACCNQLTNETIVELSNLPKLRRIGLVKCNQITDEGIIALADNAKNSQDTLERIHLSYCVNLTIYPIYKLLKACPKLTHISLTGISQFLRPDITQFCREPPSEFNPHQKSIFCVFSGDGVKLLKNHLSHIIQTTEVEDREATEILQIINGIIGTTTPTNIENFQNPQSIERFNHFVATAMDFLSDYNDLAISIETMQLFARCIFGGIQQTQATRVQRFFQLMHDRPARVRLRNRARDNLIRQQQEIERRRLNEVRTIPNGGTVVNGTGVIVANEIMSNNNGSTLAVYEGVEGLPSNVAVIGRFETMRNNLMGRRRAEIVRMNGGSRDVDVDESRQLANIPNEPNRLFQGVNDVEDVEDDDESMDE